MQQPLTAPAHSALAGEQLYTLRQLALHKQAPVRRLYDTLKRWHAEGEPNLSGDVVRLECVEVSGILHSSLEAYQRFIAATNCLTLLCHCLGGCLEGRKAKLSDHVTRVTSGELIRAGALRPPIAYGAPADQLYYRMKWVNSKGELVPFLIWSQLGDSEQKIRKIVEGK